MLMPKSTQSLQSTTKARKGLLQYNLAHGSVSMERHPLNEHLEESAKYKIKSKSFKGGGNRGRSHSYDILGAGMLWKLEEARILKNFINQWVNIR
jgi:hypothetical protein